MNAERATHGEMSTWAVWARARAPAQRAKKRGKKKEWHRQNGFADFVFFSFLVSSLSSFTKFPRSHSLRSRVRPSVRAQHGRRARGSAPASRLPRRCRCRGRSCGDESGHRLDGITPCFDDAVVCFFFFFAKTPGSRPRLRLPWRRRRLCDLATAAEVPQGRPEGRPGGDGRVRAPPRSRPEEARTLSSFLFFFFFVFSSLAAQNRPSLGRRRAVDARLDADAVVRRHGAEAGGPGDSASHRRGRRHKKRRRKRKRQ